MTEENEFTAISKILKNLTTNRQPHHTAFLQNFTSNVSFFQKITEEHNTSEIHRACCEVMSLEEYERNDTIITFGEPGEKFYIILSGSAAILVPVKKKIRMTIKQFKEYEKKCRSSSSESSSSESSVESLIEGQRKERLKEPKKRVAVIHIKEAINKPKDTIEDKKKTVQTSIAENEEKAFLKLFKEKLSKDRNQIMQVIKEADQEYIEIEIERMEEVGTLKAGDSFGELALMSNRPRAATIIAKEHMGLLVLRKSQFKTILGAISENKVTARIKFLQSLSYFSSWSKIALSKLAYFFQILTFSHKQLLFSQGQRTSGIYFIREGEFILTHKYHKKSFEKHSFNGNQEFYSEQRIKLPKIVKELQVVIKGKNESVGAYEVINNMQLRVFSCTCISSVSEVYFLPSEHFWTKIPNVEFVKEILVEENKRVEERFSQVRDIDKPMMPKNMSIDVRFKNHLLKLRDSPKRSRSPLSQNLTPISFSKRLTLTEDHPYYKPNPDLTPPTSKQKSYFMTEDQISQAVNGRYHLVFIKPRSNKSLPHKRSPPRSFLLKFREKLT